MPRRAWFCASASTSRRSSAPPARKKPRTPSASSRPRSLRRTFLTSRCSRFSLPAHSRCARTRPASAAIVSTRVGRSASVTSRLASAAASPATACGRAASPASGGPKARRRSSSSSGPSAAPSRAAAASSTRRPCHSLAAHSQPNHSSLAAHSPEETVLSKRTVQLAGQACMCTRAARARMRRRRSPSGDARPRRRRPHRRLEDGVGVLHVLLALPPLRHRGRRGARRVSRPGSHLLRRRLPQLLRAHVLQPHLLDAHHSARAERLERSARRSREPLARREPVARESRPMRPMLRPV
mmetsp:Transcript_28783/g.85667  ORF Transcript_28783/g.85667 Transcript_28783/m.85667 type:complete len:297 (+) Transcript_28783:274-1164(+)